MCSVMGLLMGVGGFMQYRQIQQQAAAQSAMYEAKARQDEANSNIVQKQNERIAEQYAGQQSKLNDKLRLFRGANTAEAGASGLSLSGSAMDVLGAGYDEYLQDSINLLDRQRSDTYSGRISQYNLDESAKGNRSAASNIRQQAKTAGIGTILGTAASIFGAGSGGSFSGGISSGGARGITGGMGNPYSIAIKPNDYDFFTSNSNKNLKIW